MIIEINKKKLQDNKPRSKVKETDTWRDKYQHAKMSIDANFSSKFTLISKLGWFASLRDNLLKHL